jgi:hypothetical protein
MIHISRDSDLNSDLGGRESMRNILCNVFNESNR